MSAPPADPPPAQTAPPSSPTPTTTTSEPALNSSSSSSTSPSPPLDASTSSTSSSSSSSSCSSSTSSPSEAATGEPCRPPLSLGSACLHIEVGVQSVQGARPTMEDEHSIVVGANHKAPDGSAVVQPDETKSPNDAVTFLGVYDGHGGGKASKFLREQLHSALFSHAALLTDPAIALKESILGVERTFLSRAKEEMLDDGSTLAVVLIVGSELFAANVGDSETVLALGPDPSTDISVLSAIHNMQKNSSEETRVKGLGGVVHNKRLGHPKINPHLMNLAVTRSIGDVLFKDEEFTGGKRSGLVADPEVQHRSVKPGDHLLIIGCDGLWDVTTYQQAVDAIRRDLAAGMTVQKSCEALVAEALKKGSKDNITVMVTTLKCSNGEGEQKTEKAVDGGAGEKADGSGGGGADSNSNEAKPAATDGETVK